MIGLRGVTQRIQLLGPLLLLPCIAVGQQASSSAAPRAIGPDTAVSVVFGFNTKDDDKDDDSYFATSFVLNGHNAASETYNKKKHFDDNTSETIPLHLAQQILKSNIVKPQAAVRFTSVNAHDTWKFTITARITYSDGSCNEYTTDKYVLDSFTIYVKDLQLVGACKAS